MRKMQNASGIANRAVRRGLAALVAGLCLAAAVGRAQTTTGNVTWDGSGGSGNPYWNVAVNWATDLAPVNPTTATVTYNAGGQSVTGVLDAARSVGNLNADAVTASHRLDLGGNTLTVPGLFRSRLDGTFTLTNGTLRIGADSAAGNLTVGSVSSSPDSRPCSLVLSPGMTFDGYKVNALRLDCSTATHVNHQSPRLDLRGVTVAGGTLGGSNIWVESNYRLSSGSYIAVDATTAMTTLAVTNQLILGGGQNNGRAYIGNPADASKRLPPGIDIRVGNPSRRGLLALGQAHNGGGNNNDLTLSASSGGEIVAYLSDLIIMKYTGTGLAQMDAMLNLSAMTNCLIDTQNLEVGVNVPGKLDANPRGTIKLPAGALTARTAVIGGTAGLGFGRFETSNTVVTVTNALTLNKTGVITINMGATPKGIDVQGTFTDGGGSIHVNFLASPSLATNWALRVVGDARVALHSMAGSGRLTSTGAYAGKEAAVIYDGSYTYFAMVDEFVSPPIALAKEGVTFEIEPGGTVLMALSEMDNGSYDPEGRTPVAVTLSSGGAYATSLSFDAADDYSVTVRIEVGDPVVETATAVATVSVVALDAGSTANRTWLGNASTVLMNRREWWWKGSWLEGTPPANPTPGTITFAQYGQTVTSLLEQDRQIGGLTLSTPNAHTLNLNGRTLTIAGVLRNERTLVFTNGTVQVGTAAVAGTLNLGLVQNAATPTVTRFTPGTVLDTRRVNAIQFGNIPPQHVNDSNSQLDLRGAGLADGVLSANTLKLNATDRAAAGTYIALDSTTVISAIIVSNNLTLGEGIYGGTVYIGNPSDAAKRLPPGVSLQVGSAPGGVRGALLVGKNGGPANTLTATLKASSGGRFTAFLSDLKLVPYEASYTGNNPQNGTLDLGGMAGCDVDAQTILVAPNYSANASAQPRGTLRLPSGAVTAGTVEIGASLGTGFGLLETSNTVFAVTNTITLRKTAVVTNRIASVSSGLDIMPSGAGALTVDPAARLVLKFMEPATSKPHYGLRWAGDHKTALDDMIGDGRLVIDDAGLGREATVFVTGGFTYVGLKPAGGTVLTVR